ncbi:hypothetical protein [Arcobacter peruensis]|uniref:Uncharacterized protein n=1 Tax=Poseidonibacter parvus TaxID=1850254 RepID=A0A1P8KMY4_9BACT|nr:hypothetical protein [Arcobacter peruensis]APW65937.1 hypothetical protein LPB137_08735 [Poseidonibacter parvus]
MTRNNLDNPIFLFTFLLVAITINTISSIHFLLIMLAGVTFVAFYTCLKRKYLYSLLFVVLTFFFIEINSGLKPFSLTLLSLFIYIFIIPKTHRIMSFSSLNEYIYILIFYLGVFFIWVMTIGMSDSFIAIIFVNIIIDLLFFGVFI